ncbi:MAG TPA: hypothetical protein VLT89_14390 [Usitatibacter sp.]|nr:hypothetical protein [Usitatibacter sp.]
MLAEPLKPKVIDLAGDIYARLVGDCAKVTAQGGIAFSSDPELLAQLSFKLAAAFQKVEDGLNRASQPVDTNFKLDAADIAAWSK